MTEADSVLSTPRRFTPKIVGGADYGCSETRTKPRINRDDVFPTSHRSAGPNMRTFLFRSYDVILEADEAELVRDVRFDLHKAQVKLRKIKERLQSVREQSAAQIEQLTAADNKLSAAIVAALLSTRKEG